MRASPHHPCLLQRGSDDTGLYFLLLGSDRDILAQSVGESAGFRSAEDVADLGAFFVDDIELEVAQTMLEVFKVEIS